MILNTQTPKGFYKQPGKAAPEDNGSGHPQKEDLTPQRVNEIKPEHVIPFDEDDDFKNF